MGPGSFNLTPAGVIHQGRVVGSEPVLMLETFDRERDSRLVDKDGPPPKAIGEGFAAERPQFVCVKASEIKWQAFGQGLPVEFAVLHEDADTNTCQLMLRVSGAMYVPRHWHPAGESFTVLKGVYTTRCRGERSRLDTGSYGYIPPSMVQNGTVGDEGVTMLICAHGGWKTNWVEDPTTPADPQEKKE
jgi:quercetin dioxygenase-like cupin family protein